MEKFKLSVIIPAKNEESNIGRCLNSLFEMLPDSCATEIILVDCNSSDNTIETAKSFPIKILSLKPEWFHSASAARYFGAKFSTGEFIFFIDADMTLEPGFLESAIVLLRSNSKIAAAGGIGKEIYLRDGSQVGSTADIYRVDDKIKKIDSLGGAGLYRKSCLDESGSFNPYLRTGGEDRELSQRLRNKGYLLFSLPIPMICHYTASIEEWTEFARKRKSNMFLGIGEFIRISISPKFLLETLLYYKEFTVFMIVLLYALAVIISDNTRLLFAPFFLLYIFLIIKKRSFRIALVSMLKWALISFDIIRGIMRRPKDRSLYPTDIIIIKGAFNGK